MATLTIRKLPDEVHVRLRLRAARRGRSMEAEAREILSTALHEESIMPLEPRVLADWLDGVLGGHKPRDVVDAFIRERHEEAAKEDEEVEEWLRSTRPSR